MGHETDAELRRRVYAVERKLAKLAELDPRVDVAEERWRDRENTIQAILDRLADVEGELAARIELAARRGPADPATHDEREEAETASERTRARLERGPIRVGDEVPRGLALLVILPGLEWAGTVRVLEHEGGWVLCSFETRPPRPLEVLSCAELERLTGWAPPSVPRRSKQTMARIQVERRVVVRPGEEATSLSLMRVDGGGAIVVTHEGVRVVVVLDEEEADRFAAGLVKVASEGAKAAQVLSPLVALDGARS